MIHPLRVCLLLLSSLLLSVSCASISGMGDAANGRPNDIFLPVIYESLELRTVSDDVRVFFYNRFSGKVIISEDAIRVESEQWNADIPTENLVHVRWTGMVAPSVEDAEIDKDYVTIEYRDGAATRILDFAPELLSPVTLDEIYWSLQRAFETSHP